MMIAVTAGHTETDAHLFLLACLPEDLRTPFERYGPVKDVYLPRKLLHWLEIRCEPRGFGFVKYRYGEDAAEAKQQLNHTIIGGLVNKEVVEGGLGQGPQDADIDPTLGLHHQPGMIQGMAGVGMIIILLSDQDLILGLSLLVMGRTTGGPLIPGRMVGVLMTRRISHLADLRVLGLMIAAVQGLVRGHTVRADLPSSM
ncbi:RNA-binding domain superfamily [Sesbania bispinosa]|nr:RNA-binding domain superfamily [Sesbania bispinosa]